MAKTIVQRILAETRARLEQREGLDRARSGSSLGDPALLDELMRRFAAEIAPMLSQLVAKELDHAFRSVPTSRSAQAVSPYGSEFAASRPASDSDAIRNIADLFDPDAPEADDGSAVSAESDLGFPLDELKKQLEAIMADTELGSDTSLPRSDSTELGTTLSSAASEERPDESDPGKNDGGLRFEESAPTQQIPSHAIHQARRESSDLSELLETPSDETQQITNVLDQFFRDPDDEERLGPSEARQPGLVDSANRRNDDVDDVVDDDVDADAESEVRRDGDETDPQSRPDAPEGEEEISVDAETTGDASTGDDATPPGSPEKPPAPDEIDILEEIGTSLDEKVAEYWEENGRGVLSDDEVVLELDDEETVLEEDETEIAGLDPAPSPPDASDLESPFDSPLETDALEDSDEVETRPLNLDAFPSGIREGPELEALRRHLQGLRESGAPAATQTLEIGDSSELVSVVRILQDSQGRLLATIERLAEALTSRADELTDRLSRSVTGH